MSTLAIETLTVRRGGRAILDDVSVAFGAGLTVVIGPNGAGKSTLLAVAAGLLKADIGTLTLDGEPLARIPRRALARRRAYLPQDARVEWPISVERVVALGLTPQLPAFAGLPDAMSAQVDGALSACELLDLRNRAATTLSGGERARAMLARAIVGAPELLIVDEPTAGLDPRHALDAMARLKAMAAAGTTVIAALHDLTLAARFADRIVGLRDGRVVADAPTAEALTSDMLERLFDVAARVTRDADGVAVRFLTPREY